MFNLKRVVLTALLAAPAALVLLASEPALATLGPWSPWRPTQVAGVEYQTACDNTANSSGQFEWVLALRNDTGMTLSLTYDLSPLGVTPADGTWESESFAPGQVHGGEGAGMWWSLPAPCPGQISVWVRR